MRHLFFVSLFCLIFCCFFYVRYCTRPVVCTAATQYNREYTLDKEPQIVVQTFEGQLETGTIPHRRDNNGVKCDIECLGKVIPAGIFRDKHSKIETSPF